MDDALRSAQTAEDAASLVASISAAWFGSGLSAEALVRLAYLARRYRVPSGTQLLGEGEPVRELGIVVSGRVALRIHVPGRRIVTLMIVEPGDIFGQSALVAPYRSTSVAVAVTPVDAIGLDGPGLRDALAADCCLAAMVYPRLFEALALRTDAIRQRLLDQLGLRGW